MPDYNYQHHTRKFSCSMLEVPARLTMETWFQQVIAADDCGMIWLLTQDCFA